MDILDKIKFEAKVKERLSKEGFTMTEQCLTMLSGTSEPLQTLEELVSWFKANRSHCLSGGDFQKFYAWRADTFNECRADTA